MADKENGFSFFCGGRFHAVHGLALELDISNREDFVYDQNVRTQMGRYREGKADIHPAAVALNRRVQKRLRLRKCDNGIELSVNLFAAHAEDCAVQVYIFSAGQFRMKTGSDLQEACHSAIKIDLTTI
jgi:hypothetical protein